MKYAIAEFDEKMCNMCILTYLRNCYKNDFVEEKKDEQGTSKTE